MQRFITFLFHLLPPPRALAEADPIDDPAIRRMDLRTLADLPLPRLPATGRRSADS